MFYQHFLIISLTAFILLSTHWSC